MHAAAVMILAASVRIGFDMPFDGKATLALDGPDGRSEDGTGAPPGRYTVRVVAHPGIGYDFRGAFAAGGERIFSGFGPNHLPCTMLAAQVGGRAFAYSKSGGNAPEWKCEGALPELDGDGLDADGAVVAVWEKSVGRILRFEF